MSPANKNFVVATGADNRFAMRYHGRGENVAASTIVAGDWIIYSGQVWPVFASSPAGASKTELILGYGTFADPRLTLNDDDLVATAPPMIWQAVDMQVALPETVWSPPPTTQVVPTSIIDEGVTCLIEIGQEWLEPFQQQIDYASGGPSGMSMPYDLVGTFDGARLRILTGTISIVRSAASPIVEPPVVPVVTP